MNPDHHPILRSAACGFASLLLALSALHAQAPAGITPVPLPQEASDLKADPAIHWGLLPNGLRYAILPNAEPPKRVSLRLFVDAGSLMEQDDQQGLAHFLEHMAFNGTKHFPAGQMVEYFQRLGMGFGSHTNAHTSFNETVYKLEMPTNEIAQIDEGFTLMRDQADGMLLLANEVDRERGVIMSEKRSRDSAQWRTFVSQLEFALPDSLISRRLPIGQEEVIMKAPQERFAEFYRNWYTADRMVVIVVGDVKPEDIEPVIHKHFESLAAPAAKRPPPDLGKVSARGLAVHYHPEKEAGEVSVSIDAVQPTTKDNDSQALRALEMRHDLASRMIGRRLEVLAKQPESPIIQGTMHHYDLFDLRVARYSSISADCQPDKWQAAMSLIEQELRKALQYGFTEAELKEAKANELNQYQLAAKTALTRQSRDLADTLAGLIGERRVFTTPADDLAWAQPELEKISAEECLGVLQEFWKNASERTLMVSGKVEIPDAEKTILTTFAESGKTPITPPAKGEEQAFAYAQLPAAGTIVDRKTVEDLGITQLTLSNGVHANLKVTDFEKGRIYLRLRFGGGRLVEPKDKPGLSFFSSHVLTEGGLEAHSIDELARIFAGKSLESEFAVQDDAFTFTGSTTPDDLQDQLLLLRAYLTAPGYREEAASQFRRGLDTVYQRLENTPDGYAQMKVATFLRSGDTRFGMPERATMAAYTMADARAWLTQAFQSASLEVTAVGDFDAAKMEQSLAAAFGSLPEREKTRPSYESERLVKFPTGATTQRHEIESAIPKALSMVYWPTADMFNIQRTRRLGVLGDILDDRLRLKIREELGDAYSPFATNRPSDTFKDYGYLMAAVIAAPGQADTVATVMQELAGVLGKGDNITKDELDRAMRPQITQIEEFRRTNGYWLNNVLQNCQEYPERLAWARTFRSDYETITLEEIQQLAREYLGSSPGVSIVVLPKANPAGSPPPAPADKKP